MSHRMLRAPSVISILRSGLRRISSSPAVHVHATSIDEASISEVSRVSINDAPNFRFRSHRNKTVVETSKKSTHLIRDPFKSKGMAFNLSERDRFGIRGLLPPRILSFEEQIARQMKRLEELPTPFEKYRYLSELHDRNEAIFHQVVRQNIRAVGPVVYTPTVGEACQKFGRELRNPRGMYFSTQDQGLFHGMLYNWPTDDVDCIVVTDGSRILGLGDLGANGMGIPIGKLVLYCAVGGIHPNRVLPIMLDVGTDNVELRNNPYYLGMRHPRLKGSRYDEFFDEFMSAIIERYPDTLVQFEDFSSDNASRLLERYRDKLLCFNDDIQGTGSMCVGGLLGALRVRGEGPKDLIDQRIVVLGAGSAGIGVSTAIKTLMMNMGLTEKQALQRFYVVDADGLVGSTRQNLLPYQLPFARYQTLSDKMAFLSVMKEVKPTVLLGFTGYPGSFTQEIITEMSKHTDRPIIFPLSNPTSRAECTAEQVYQWSNGKAICASGSPFPKVEVNGVVRETSQGNNMYIFPGLGQGSLLAQATRITDNMLLAASLKLADCVGPDEIRQSLVFPSIDNIVSVSKEVSKAVFKAAIEDGVATIALPVAISISSFDSFVDELIHKNFYDPVLASKVQLVSTQPYRTARR